MEGRDYHDDRWNLSRKFKKDYNGAIRELENALEYDPNYSSVCYSLGNVYLNKGNLDEAIKWFSRCIEVNPNDADAYNQLGYSYINKGKDGGYWERAKQCFQRVIELEPGSERANHVKQIIDYLNKKTPAGLKGN